MERFILARHEKIGTDYPLYLCLFLGHFGWEPGTKREPQHTPRGFFQLMIGHQLDDVVVLVLFLSERTLEGGPDDWIVRVFGFVKRSIKGTLIAAANSPSDTSTPAFPDNHHRFRAGADTKSLLSQDFPTLDLTTRKLVSSHFVT